MEVTVGSEEEHEGVDDGERDPRVLQAEEAALVERAAVEGRKGHHVAHFGLMVAEEPRDEGMEWGAGERRGEAQHAQICQHLQRHV